MSLEELQVRTWIAEWKEFNHWDNINNPLELEPTDYIIHAADPREGVKDFNYRYYDSIAYEALSCASGDIIARAEGRDALLRLCIVMNNFMKLKHEE